jgi:hypothetical protein
MTTPSKRLPKFKRAPRAAPRIRLTDRDRAVLYDLHHYRFLPTSLIRRRHFGSETRARSRLKLLYHHGFVDRMFLPSAGPTTSEAIYSLGPAAVGELAVFYGLEPAQLKRRRRPVEPFFVEHELLVARFRMHVAYAGAPKGVAIRDWRDGDRAKLLTPASGPDGSETDRPITPDGMGWVYSKVARFAFCFEADRGTMTVGRVRTKFERYQRAGDAVKAALGADRFRVLVVAPSQKRLASLRAAVESAHTRNVWLVTEQALEGDLVADSVWERAGVAGHFPLLTAKQLRGQQSPTRASNHHRAQRRAP